MFKKFFTFFVMAAMAAAMLTGCDKDPKPEDEQTDPVQLVSKITYEDGKHETYEYDDKNFLTKVTYYTKDGALESTVTLNYDSNGELTSMKADFPQNPELNGTALYTKTGNRIDRCGDSDGDGKCDKSSEIYLEVNAQNELVKQVFEYTSGQEAYVTTNANGNATKMTYEYEESGITHTGDVTVYTYDDKKSPFHDCATPSWLKYYMLSVSKNNVLTETSTDSNGDVDESNYTYSYDEAGYALTCEYVDDAGDKGSVTYTYIKK